MKERAPTPNDWIARLKFAEAISRPDALFDCNNKKDFAWVVRRAIKAYGVTTAELHTATQFPQANFEAFAEGRFWPPIEPARKFVFDEIAKALSR